jgi:hypothetical protein
MFSVTNDNFPPQVRIHFKDKKSPFVHDYARQAAHKTGYPHTVWRQEGKDKDWKKIKTYKP